jgi:arsenate reductase-like glutaredoxin family protein
MTCRRTQEFLARTGVATIEMADARKRTMTEKDALALVRDVDEIYAARGKNVVHFDLRKDRPGRQELLAALLGPTGNLRAPASRVGRTLIVGFDEGLYRKLIG